MKKLFLTRFFIALSLFCYLPFVSQNFTWVKGSTTSSVAGTYGTQGVSLASNTPGGRHGGVTWTDASGNLWLFGGEGYTTNTSICWLNDLWKYNPTTNQWTWIRGTNTPNTIGIYGTQGLAATGNEPGAREFAMGWTDASGNFWLFGGDGFASTSTFGRLADLWKYNPTTNQWTWMNGPNTIGVSGVYGTQNVTSSTSFPGARYWAAAWADNTNGNLWIFGGRGFVGGNDLRLNDLWKYNIASNQWTWVSGNQAGNVPGVFGSLSVPSATNYPGGREFSSFWSPASGKLVLFGGLGYAAGPNPGDLNDMWEFDVTTGIWTWVNGSNATNQAGIYGTLGVPSTANTPGARYCADTWIDAMGNYWLFGGQGFGATTYPDRLNDLFRYNPVTFQWTWMKGSNQLDQNGVYGTQGVAAPTNKPGSRYYSIWWKKPVNNSFWLFGAYGYDAATGTPDNMNDLWKYTFPCSPDSIKALPGASICSGNAVNLTAFNQAPTSVTWYASATSSTSIGSGSLFSTPQLTTQNTPSTFSYYADANSCTVVPRAMITITVLPLPLVSILGPVSVCHGVSATLTASGAQSYTWSTGMQSPSIQATPAGAGFTCTATGSGTNGCQNSVSYIISLFPVPNVAATSAKSLICNEESVVLTASGASTYTWNGTAGTASILISPTITTTYTVAGTDLNGCSSSYTITQFVAGCDGIAEQASAQDKLTISPNPNRGTFVISLSSQAKLILIDQLGEQVLEKELTPGDNKIETLLSKNIYLYRVLFSNGNARTGKLLVE